MSASGGGGGGETVKAQNKDTIGGLKLKIQPQREQIGKAGGKFPGWEVKERPKPPKKKQVREMFKAHKGGTSSREDGGRELATRVKKT